MNTQLDKYKNIDKSTHCIFNEEKSFKVIHFKNLTDENELLKHELNYNFIQIYFSLRGKCTVAFNQEHCAMPIDENKSLMVYFKDEKMNLLFNIPPSSELIVLMVCVEYFHSLFSIEGNFLFNLNTSKPIIEQKEITPILQLILNQLVSKQINDKLRPVYIKGKVYEMLSYYFSGNSNQQTEDCPYISNEETIGKIKKVKEIIIDNMNNPPSLAELAKEVGLNIKKLKTDFKEFYGQPVFTYLLNYKMELGKKLLQENNLNVNEIAVYLGYTTSSHFIAAFKRKYGITPKQFSKS